MNTKNIIMDYEKLLLSDNGVNLKTNYFSYNEYHNEKLALALFRYAIEEILHWSPEDVVDCLDLNTIKNLHLLVPYRYLVFPDELSKRNDCFYIAHLLYPKRIPYSMRNLVELTYQRVLNHEAGKFPKEYFSGADGQLRACICLQYLLIEHLSFTSIEEMYYYFSTTKAMSMLRKFRLATVCSELYDSPLEFLHNALPTQQKNDLYFHYYRFQAGLKSEKLKTKVSRIVGD